LRHLAIKHLAQSAVGLNILYFRLSSLSLWPFIKCVFAMKGLRLLVNRSKHCQSAQNAKTKYLIMNCVIYFSSLIINRIKQLVISFFQKHLLTNPVFADLIRIWPVAKLAPVVITALKPWVYRLQMLSCLHIYTRLIHALYN